MFSCVHKGLAIDDVGVSTDTVSQEIHGRELVLKPAIFVKKRKVAGGATVKRLFL